MAKYRALTKTFIAPHTIEEGQTFTISADWPPGPHVEPLDEEAEAAMEAYLKAKVDSGEAVPTLHPVDALSNTVETIGEPPPKVQEDLSLSFAEAAAQPATKGPTDGGKVKG